eukprot:2126055-Rhodomonas_salina.1
MNLAVACARLVPLRAVAWYREVQWHTLGSYRTSRMNLVVAYARLVPRKAVAYASSVRIHAAQNARSVPHIAHAQRYTPYARTECN